MIKPKCVIPVQVSTLLARDIEKMLKGSEVNRSVWARIVFYNAVAEFKKTGKIATLKKAG